jgi:AraC-like DNA-binding protein/mannose-6-phosphate isomerase-like protein (cupin superfamily)
LDNELFIKEEYKNLLLCMMNYNDNELDFFINKVDFCNPKKHMHEYVQIMYVYKGKFQHVINNNSFNVVKGDIFVIPPYIPHYFIDEYHEKIDILDLSFLPRFLSEKFPLHRGESGFVDFLYLEPFLVSENQVKPRLNLSGEIMYEVEGIFDEILKEYNKQDNDFELLIRALLLKLLVIVGREFRKDSASSKSYAIFDRHRNALYNTIKYICENYNQDLELANLARMAILSQSYFRFLFKQMTHKSLNDYISDIRIKKAMEILKNNNNMRIIDICEEIGYKNINHFNRIFKLKTGNTPTEFRKASR